MPAEGQRGRPSFDIDHERVEDLLNQRYSIKRIAKEIAVRISATYTSLREPGSQPQPEIRRVSYRYAVYSFASA